MVFASFHYPRGFIPVAQEYGLPPFGEGGEFDEWEQAFERARQIVQENNHPVEVTGTGNMCMTFYPKGMGYADG